MNDHGGLRNKEQLKKYTTLPFAAGEAQAQSALILGGGPRREKQTADKGNANSTKRNK